MGGAHVFPGGRVDAADRIPDPDSCCAGAAEAAARLPDLPPNDVVGHCVGALRELFEEVGILLARSDRGGSSGVPAASALATHRAALAAGETTLAVVAEQEQMQLDLAALHPFGHWVTPESEVKRYDVRFFMAEAPVGQTAGADVGEVTEAVWCDPTDALDRCRAGQMLLAPPTWTTLRWLERFRSVGEALAWAGRRHDWLVQPQLFEQDGSRMLALPGNERYPPVAGFEAAETLFRFSDGRWRAIEA